MSQISSLDFSNLQVNVDELPKAEALCFHPLEKRFIRVFQCEILLVYTLLMTLEWGCYAVIDKCPLWAAILIMVILSLFMIAHLCFSSRIFNFRGYALRERDLTYRKGIFFHTEETISFKKVQQVTITQGPLHRLFGLHALQIEDASQSSQGIKIPGLTKALAENIKSYILERIDHGAS